MYVFLIYFFSYQLSSDFPHSSSTFPIVSVSVYLSYPVQLLQLHHDPPFLLSYRYPQWFHNSCWGVISPWLNGPLTSSLVCPIPLSHTLFCHSSVTYRIIPWTLRLWRWPVAPPSNLVKAFTLFCLCWALLQPDLCFQSPQSFQYICSLMSTLYLGFTVTFLCCQILISWSLTNLY